MLFDVSEIIPSSLIAVCGLFVEPLGFVKTPELVVILGTDVFKICALFECLGRGLEITRMAIRACSFERYVQFLGSVIETFFQAPDRLVEFADSAKRIGHIQEFLFAVFALCQLFGRLGVSAENEKSDPLSQRSLPARPGHVRFQLFGEIRLAFLAGVDGFGQCP